MPLVKLFHNPKAGDEDHDKRELVSLIEANGFKCIYTSVKKDGWDEVETGVDILAVAGGDGTVRKLAKKILKGKIAKEPWPPIALLPLGTANNIATTLGINDKKPEELISSWQKNKRKKFDLGGLYGTGDYSFFLESFGYGIFPYLIKQMQKKEPNESATPEENLKASLETLYQEILSYEPRQCMLRVNDKDYSGKYIMAEVMNTKMLGPNIGLAMKSDPGDGVFEVVVVSEQDKGKFAAFILDKINGVDSKYDFQTIKGKTIDISWDGTHVHTDDEVLKIKKEEKVKIDIKPGVFEFIVP